MPLISVIIPTYNRGSVLPRAVLSVLKQTWPSWELIIVDDGSTDGTQLWVKSLDDPRITYTRHAVNRNAAAARNTGIQLANGSMVAFLDSDDEWLPSKLEMQVQALDSRGPEWGASYAHVIRVRDSGWVVAGVEDDRQILDRYLMVPPPGAGSSLLVRRSCLDAVGPFDERLARHQDWDYIIRIARDYRIAIVRQPLHLRYANNPPSADKVAEAKELFLSKIEGDLLRLGRRRMRVTIGQHHLVTMKHLLHDGMRSNARKYALKAIRSDPRLFPVVIKHWIQIGEVGGLA